eukprot:scaffold10560_cov133-Isochrysis_galbana.AAC.23
MVYCVYSPCTVAVLCRTCFTVTVGRLAFSTVRVRALQTNPNPTPFPRHTADVSPCGARARPAPPRESSGVGGVAVTRPEGTASIATTRHPHTHHTHTQTASYLSHNTLAYRILEPLESSRATASSPPSSDPSRALKLRA